MKIRILAIALVLFLIPLVSVTAQESVARQWNEVLLEAIRKDFARPTVHSRNLFHTSVAMYDAWAAFDEEASTFFLGKTVGEYVCPFDGIATPADVEAAREEAISFAAYRLLKHRFENSPGASITFPEIEQLMTSLGYDGSNTSIDYTQDGPAALGNFIANNLIAFGLGDGANELNGYENQFYEPANPPMIVEFSGNPNMVDPNRWQPLTLEVFIDQSGNVIPGATPDFLGPEWGAVTPFSLKAEDLTINERDGNYYWLYHDPGLPPLLDLENGSGNSAEYQWGHALVAAWSSHMAPSDGVMWDISPAAIGNIDVETYPTDIEGLRDFYDLANGGDPGQGRDLNPVTGEPYQANVVARGDYTRVLAEFWADGPDSETPPGHWFTLLNHVSDHPQFIKQFNGQGDILTDLEWDVKAYLTLGGTMHDVAVSIWGIKGWYDYARPVSSIRKMADLGQSSNEGLPSYDVAGIPLIDGKIELVMTGDPLAGSGDINVGKIKVLAWRGPDYVTVPATQQAGVDWILAENWWPYQRPSFVTPNFAGYLSGHSTFSRAAAEVMTALTGDAFFPGGMGEFVATHNEFLVFEEGPSEDITLQWATYRDASDQCSLSRIWGGIHPPVDDIPGRLIGIEVGEDAFELARSLFYKDEDQDGFYSYEDCDDTKSSVYPGAPEICDGLDNDCNDEIDEGVLITFYWDEDVDGFGNPLQSIEACTVPMGYVLNNMDCNDSNGNEFPGQQWYVDLDMDGYSSGELIVACTRPANTFLESELLQIDGDCNDDNSNEFPGQEWYVDQDSDGYSSGELINNCGRPADAFLAEELLQIDGDCNDNLDIEFPGQVWFIDNDEDGYGDGTMMESCTRPNFGFLMTELLHTTTDCDNDNATVYLGAMEVCDGLDNDCNGFIDDDLTLYTYYLDSDNDGFGELISPIDTCKATPPENYVDNASDCDDSNGNIYPNAIEIADNDIDEDCTGIDLFRETKVFPNPVRDELTIHFVYEGTVDLLLHNVEGQLIRKEAISIVDNQLMTSVSQLNPGVYLLRLMDEKGESLLLYKVVKL